MPKKRVFIFISILIILLVTSCSLNTKERPNLSKEETTEEENIIEPNSSGTITPVYVTINSHNENNWNVGTEKIYLAYREDLVERLQLIKEYNAKLNWESDYAVLLGMQEFETQDLFSNTNNKNILRYITEDLDFSVDPHNHPSDYNYADIAYLIEQLDVEPSGVIGGLIVFECVNHQPQATNWHETLDLEDDGYVYGKMYPDYKWQPEILSGAGSSGHVYDELTSGMWHPGIEEEFYNDQGEGIVITGQGYDHDATLISESNGETLYYEDGGYIKELVEKIQSGELPAGKMYTANLHVQDKATITGGMATNDALQQVLDSLKPYADAGLIKYVTYQEAVDIWETEYNSEPNQADISTFSQYENIVAQQQTHC